MRYSAAISGKPKAILAAKGACENELDEAAPDLEQIACDQIRDHTSGPVGRPLRILHLRKVLTAYFLNTWTDHSIRFLQRLPTWFGFVLHSASSSDVVRHVGFQLIEESKGVDLNFPSQQSKLPTLQKKYFGDLKRHTWA